MYDYYRSLPGYLSMIANISLIIAIIFLFFNWHISIFLFGFTIILWFLSRSLHNRYNNMNSYLKTGLKKSAAILAERYKSPEGIAELKRKGFTDEEINIMQETAEEDAKKGVFHIE